MMFQYSRGRWFFASGGGGGGGGGANTSASFVVLLNIMIFSLLVSSSSSSSVFAVAESSSSSPSSSSSSSRSSSTTSTSSTSTSTLKSKDNNNNNNCPTDILQYTVSGCKELHQIHSQKQPPSNQYWKELRDIYIDVVGINKSTISWPIGNNNNNNNMPSKGNDDQNKNKTKNQNQTFSGIATDLVEVKYLPTKGRGLYAKTSIPNGTIVWDHWYHAIFTNECSFKLFLSKITWTQACDALQWCYVYDYDDDDDDDDDEDDNEDDNEYLSNNDDEDDEDDDGIGIGCAFDEGSLFNHAPSGLENAGYKDSEAMEVTTLRDVQAGEELVQDYDAFETSELDWFTNLIHIAWGDDCFETDDVDIDDDDSDDDVVDNKKEEL